MVLQTQIDVLDMLMGNCNNNFNEMLTPEGEVFSFPTARTMDSETLEVDFLDENVMSMSTVTIESVQDESSGSYTEDSESPLYNDAFTFQFHNKIVTESTGSSQATSTSSMTDIFEIDEVPSAFTLQEIDDSIALTPLLKEGIKYKIQTRRKAEGKDELKVEFKEPEPEKLTEEEEELRKVRREKNKLAAQKCRRKKREIADTLQEETEKLQVKQRKLQKEIESLRTEKEHLEEIIKVHSFVCPKFLVS